MTVMEVDSERIGNVVALWVLCLPPAWRSVISPQSWPPQGQPNRNSYRMLLPLITTQILPEFPSNRWCFPASLFLRRELPSLAGGGVWVPLLFPFPS